jgi:hypothetical protein
MAYSSSRPTSAVLASTSTSSSIRQQSNHNAISHQQSLALSSRIVSKKAELENLMRLRDLSGVMAMQMQVLETKIGTLKHGTEGSLPRCSFFCILPRFLQNVEVAKFCTITERKEKSRIRLHTITDPSKFLTFSCGLRTCKLGQRYTGYQYGFK